jgi:hypothetical protein
MPGCGIGSGITAVLRPNPVPVGGVNNLTEAGECHPVGYLICGKHFDSLIAASGDDDRNPRVNKPRSCPGGMSSSGDAHYPARSQHRFRGRFIADSDC